MRAALYPYRASPIHLLVVPILLLTFGNFLQLVKFNMVRQDNDTLVKKYEGSRDTFGMKIFQLFDKLI